MIVDKRATAKDDQGSYLEKVIELIVSFAYNECANQFINDNGSVSDMIFFLLKACCNDGRLFS
jgi:hypothetical protein